MIRGRYEPLETVGSGGEGQVVKALDHQHGRIVALKIRGVASDAPVDEVLREPRVLLGLAPHPALPLVREDFFEGHAHYTVLDWVDGTDLETLVRTKGTPGLTPASVLAYLAEAAAALTFLHQHDPPVIHGDLKPANLILTRGGRIVLVDFGLSSSPHSAGRRSGTPGYQAPEVAAGGPPSRAADVYALAATAFALITGAPPDGDLPRWDGLDATQARRLQETLRAGLATDPARRPATPGELVERLRGGWASDLPTGVVTFVAAEIDPAALDWDADPQRAADMLVRCDEILAVEVESRGGRLRKAIGEASTALAAFDSSEQAVAAAIAAARALTADDAAPVRFGVHTGEAQLRGDSYMGPAVSLATRIREEAKPGEVLLSQATAELTAADLPEGYALTDVGTLTLDASRRSEALHAVTGPGLVAPHSTDCPYLGLLAFGPDDSSLFFGREQELDNALARIIPGGLLAVVGASGSGKSSLLGAGVASAVRSGAIGDARRARVINPGPEPSPEDLDGPVDELLIVDQFEELFTQCRDADVRAAFVARLLARKGPTVIGLRADYYGDATQFPELAVRLAANQVLLGPMPEADLRRAIAEPARRAGLRLEPGLVDRILRDVADEPGSLPLMSHALRETWERRRGRTLTVADYEASGGVSSAVARTADAVVAATPEADRPLLRSLFIRLTELGDDVEDTRRRVPIDELVPAGETSGTARTLLERLSAVRLVTLDAGTAEVAHEVLIRRWPTLRRWLDDDREGIRLHRRLSDSARLWEAGGRLSSDLYRGPRLEALREWAEDNAAEINATERAFLQASDQESRRQQRREALSVRRLRQSLGVAAGLLLAAAALLVFAVLSRTHAVHAERTARQQSATSRSQRIAAAAQTQVGSDPQLALLLARAALKAAPTQAAMLATSDALDANTLQAQLPSMGVQSCLIANYPSLLDGGRILVNNTCDGSVVFVDLVRRQIIRRLNVGPSTGEMTLIDGGRTLLLASGYDVLAIDVASGRVHRRFRSPLFLEEVVLSPDGRTYALTDGTAVALVDARTLRTRTIAHGDASANQLANIAWASNRMLLLETNGQTRGAGDLAPGVSALDVRTGHRTTVRLPVNAGSTASLSYMNVSPDRRTWYFNGSEVSPGTNTQRAVTWAIRADTRTPRWINRGPTGTRATPATLSSPDNTLVAISYGEGSVTVLDARTGATVIRHHTSSSLVAGWMGFRPGNRTLITLGLDGVVRLYRNRPTARLRFQTSPAPAFGFMPGGDLLLVGARGRIADRRTGRVRHTFPGFPATRLFGTCAAACVSVAPGGRRLSYVDPSSTTPRIVEVDPAAGAHVAAVSVPRADAQSVTADGRIVVDWADPTVLHVEVIDPRSGSRRQLRPVRTSVGCSGTAPAFTPDTRLVGVVDGCDRLTVWDVRSGAIVRSFRLPNRSNGAAAGNGGTSATSPVLSPDGRYALITLEGGGLVRADLRSSRIEQRPGTGRDAQALAVSPDGRFYAVGREAGTVDEYSARTLSVVRHLVLTTPVRAIAFSPDSREVAVKDADNVISVFDTCALCQDAAGLAARARRESVRALTPSERATFGVASP